MSDRALTDLGFECADLDTQIKARFDSLQEARRQEARVCRELMAYSDAELDDISVKRVDFTAAARGAYQFKIRASNPVTTVARPAPAANDPHHAAAASGQ